MPLLFYSRLFGNDAAVVVSPPATPALSIADNGDGTGAVATITGSAASSTNIVSTAPWVAAGNNLTWTAATPRTGDGTVALSLTNGLYVARCESTLGGLPAASGNEPLFQTTGGVSFSSVHKALASSIQSTLQGLIGSGGLTGISSSSIRIRKTPYLGDFSGQNPLPANFSYSLPAIIVCYFDVEEVPPGAGSNVLDEVGYPITIVFAQETQDAATPSEAIDDQFLRWREACERTCTLLRGFNGHLTVTANGLNYTFHKCFFKGGLIFDPERANKKMDVGWMKFSFVLWRGKNNT
jgi:hypothetical protein